MNLWFNAYNELTRVRLFAGCLLILPFIRTASPAKDHRGRIAYVGGNCLHYLLVVALCVYGFLTLRAAIWGP